MKKALEETQTLRAGRSGGAKKIAPQLPTSRRQAVFFLLTKTKTKTLVN